MGREIELKREATLKQIPPLRGQPIVDHEILVHKANYWLVTLCRRVINLHSAVHY